MMFENSCICHISFQFILNNTEMSGILVIKKSNMTKAYERWHCNKFQGL